MAPSNIGLTFYVSTMYLFEPFLEVFTVSFRDASTKCDPVHEKSCNSSVLSYNLEGQTEFISQKEKYYACPDCNKWFKRKSHLITHSR